MKFEFKRERYGFEVLPSITLSWYAGPVIYIGWLVWNVCIFWVQQVDDEI